MEKPLWRQASMLADGALGYEQLEHLGTRALFEQFSLDVKLQSEAEIANNHIDARVNLPLR